MGLKWFALCRPVNLALARREEELPYGREVLCTGVTRDLLIQECATLKTEIDQLKTKQVDATSSDSREGIEKDIDEKIALLKEKEQLLRTDDTTRDSLVPPSMVESLANQIEDWRAARCARMHGGSGFRRPVSQGGVSD